jgi:predicted chitinase
VTVALEVATLTKCGVPEDVARRQLPYMQSAMRKYGITTRPRARAFLATVLHESMGLRATTEQASGARYEGRRDLGNIHRGDGQRFKGRGPIQLTGRANYAAYGRRLGMNLEGHPDMVAKPDVGWQVAGMFFQKCLPAADAGDFRRVTRLVNGGLNGWDDRLRYWNKLAGLGVVPGTPDIERGAKGPKVEMLTRRLSYLTSKKTGKPFLNGARSTFDRRTTRALRRFQKERGLKVDGVFGPRVAAELDQLVRAEKARRLGRRRCSLRSQYRRRLRRRRRPPPLTRPLPRYSRRLPLRQRSPGTSPRRHSDLREATAPTASTGSGSASSGSTRSATGCATSWPPSTRPPRRRPNPAQARPRPSPHRRPAHPPSNSRRLS